MVHYHSRCCNSVRGIWGLYIFRAGCALVRGVLPCASGRWDCTAPWYSNYRRIVQRAEERDAGSRFSMRGRAGCADAPTGVAFLLCGSSRRCENDIRIGLELDWGAACFPHLLLGKRYPRSKPLYKL